MRFIATVLISLFLLSTSVAAHIGIEPQEVHVGKVRYELVVPNEKSIATQEVRLVAPHGVTITAIEQVAGWQSNTDGVISADAHSAPTAMHQVRWYGNQILAGSYARFGFEAEYTGLPATLSWQAYQTYADGVVVAWDGSSAAASAPIVQVVDQTTEDALQANAQAARADHTKLAQLTWLAMFGLVFGFGSLLLTLKASRK
jgi:uncharacterized protein YcnI